MYIVLYSYVTFSRIIEIVLNLDDEWSGMWTIGFVDWLVGNLCNFHIDFLALGSFICVGVGTTGVNGMSFFF